MRLLILVLVFLGSFTALAFLGIALASLLGGNAWWGMLLIYPEFFAAIVITVLFARRWTQQPAGPAQ